MKWLTWFKKFSIELFNLGFDYCQRKLIIKLEENQIVTYADAITFIRDKFKRFKKITKIIDSIFPINFKDWNKELDLKELNDLLDKFQLEIINKFTR